MQTDEQLYERIFAEVFLYFYRNRIKFEDWQVVVIYPSRSTEQRNIRPYRALLETSQVHLIYLDELGDIRQLPLWVAAMVLTTPSEDQAPEEAKYLLERSQQEASTQASRAIMEMVVTIISYKFTHLNRKEVEAMLGLTLKETGVYRDIKEEVLEESRLETADMVIDLLRKRLDSVDEGKLAAVKDLSIPSLKALNLAVLDFNSANDLEHWLAKNAADSSTTEHS